MRTPIDETSVRTGFVNGRFTTIAGPCTVESRDLLLETVHAVKAAGAHMLRGGA